MIRFDQRQFDVQGTEKVFKKVVHPGQNIRLVDKDGIPLKAPNFSALSRLQSQYVLSPRGVPTKRSNHSYSGQLAQSKLHTVVNSLDTSTQPEMMSYSSVHNYTNMTNGYFRPYSACSRLSSAPSSQHYPAQRYMPGNLTPKKRAFGSGPPRSVKSMPPTTKTSASTRRSRFLTSAATTSMALTPLDQMSRSDVDGDKSNESPQGKRLEKEWSALSQCRALKRSSEIVSHRVDRMYFMTGSKLQIQSKYLVEEDDLQHLRELSQARATSRSTRFNKVSKGDIYRPDRSVDGDKSHDGSDLQINGTEAIIDKSETQKTNGKKKPPSPPESPIIKQTRSSKSPLAGWAGGDVDSKAPSVANENVHQDGLHEDTGDGEDVEGDNDAINDTDRDKHGKEDIDNKENVDNGNVDKGNVDNSHNDGKTEEDGIDKEAEKSEVIKGEDKEQVKSAKVNVVVELKDIPNGPGESVQEDGENQDADGDKTVVKSEDYLDNVDLENS